VHWPSRVKSWKRRLIVTSSRSWRSTRSTTGYTPRSLTGSLANVIEHANFLRNNLRGCCEMLKFPYCHREARSSLSECQGRAGFPPYYLFLIPFLHATSAQQVTTRAAEWWLCETLHGIWTALFEPSTYTPCYRIYHALQTTNHTWTMWVHMLRCGALQLRQSAESRAAGPPYSNNLQGTPCTSDALSCVTILFTILCRPLWPHVTPYRVMAWTEMIEYDRNSIL